MDQLLLNILDGDTSRYPSALEKQYPRILGKIMSLWDSPEIDSYFSDLMITQHDREGFPPEVASEIMHLNLVHAAQHTDNTQHDIWDNSELLTNFVPKALLAEVTGSVEPPNKIKQEIQKLGITFTSKGFLQATSACNRPAVTLFLDAEINLETHDEHGWTPLMLAAYNGCDDIVGLLLQRGALTHTTDIGGNTALHWAAFSGHHISAQLLIANHSDVNVGNNAGLTPLVQAIAHDHTKLALLLLLSSAHPNSTERNGCTPLHTAAAHGNLEVITALVRHGADIHTSNQDGDTPLQIAIKNRRVSAIKILESMK